MTTTQRIELMGIEITNITEDKNKLTFTIKNVEVCVVNAIRRTVLSNIESLVFRGFPYNETLINIMKNTTNFNNEYMKQRISCIPIMNDREETFDAFRENNKIVVNVENNTHKNVYVTTENINIINKTNGEKMSKEKVMKYFPPDPNVPSGAESSPFILLCVLFPNQSGDDSQNEAIHFECDFDIGSAKENSCWNVVHNCTYEFVRDEVKIAAKVEDIEDESEKIDFQLLDAERIYYQNEYKMTFETLGIYTNKEIVNKSCQYILSRLKLIEPILSKQQKEKILSKDTVKAKTTDGTALKEELSLLEEQYCHLYREGSLYILELKQDDYTIGKLIEVYFYKLNEDKLLFVGFKKEHPTNPVSFVYFQYKPGYLVQDDKTPTSEQIITPLIETILTLNELFKEINKYFTNNNINN